MEAIRFDNKTKATENGYQYRGYEIIRKISTCFGTTETTWFVEGEVFVTLKDAKEYLDRKVMRDYIKYREEVANGSKQ